MTDRKFTVLEYLEILKDEWWINNLRRKIYPDPIDKRHYSVVSNLKKSRIIKISNRYGIGNIFEDPEMMKALNKKFTNKGGGLPMFDGITSTDIENYYAPESIVRCFFGFEKRVPIIKMGKVIKFDIFSQNVQVRFEDLTENTLHQAKVTRIF
jgi:hypothetical protein